MQALARILAGCLSAGIFGMPVQAAPSDKPLEVGVFPYLSARALLVTYTPLKDYLEVRLHRLVTISSAPDFREFHERTLRGEYDLVITPPHFAWLAQTDARYIPINVYTKVLRTVFVVARDSPIKSVAGLRAKTIAIPDRLAIVSIMGLKHMRDMGLEPGRDFTLREFTSHASAAYSVQHRETDAVIVGMTVFQKQIPEEVRHDLRVLATLGNVPNIMFAAHPRLGQTTVERLRTLLVTFANDSPGGKDFIKASGFEGIRPVTEADKKRIEPYARELKTLLEQAP